MQYAKDVLSIYIKAEDLYEAIDLTNKQGDCESTDCIDHLSYLPVHVLLNNLGIRIISPSKKRKKK